MTPPTVTIAGKARPIPQDCVLFGCDYKGRWAVFFPALDGGMFYLDELRAGSVEMFGAAAVAVMHFENLYEKAKQQLPPEPDRMKFSPQVRRLWREERDKMLAHKQSAAAWRELCREV